MRLPRVGSPVALLTDNVDRDDRDRERKQAAGSRGVVTMVDADRVHVDMDQGGSLVFEIGDYGRLVIWDVAVESTTSSRGTSE
jgi:hypothetical protein